MRTIIYKKCSQKITKPYRSEKLGSLGSLFEKCSLDLSPVNVIARTITMETMFMIVEGKFDTRFIKRYRAALTIPWTVHSMILI